MKLIIPVGALLLMVASSVGATTPAQLLCRYNEVSYSNADEIPHANGCTKLQCQFGQVVAYWEACGKEIDGQCHAVGSSFKYQDITYQCQRTVVAEVPIYRNVRLTPVYVGCQAEGNSYQHLEKFQLSDTCRQYQCQNGVVRVIGQACGKELDGKCHDLGTWYLFNNLFYECKRYVWNGISSYVHSPIYPQPKPNVSCILGGVNYPNLGTMNAGCNKRQCQSGKIPFYSLTCKFYKDQGQCYSPNEQWVFQNKLYECKETINSDNTTSVQAQTNDRDYLKCWLSETLYDNLDTMVVDNNCGLRQCQDGQVPYLKMACEHYGQCHLVNSLWKIGDVTYKCILTSYQYRKVVRVDEYGNFDEGQKPQPPELGPPPPYEGCPAIADIIFVIDASRSMSQATFEKELDFSVAITDYFKIGPTDVRIAAVVFSNTVQKVFDLNTYDSHEGITQALRNTTFLKSTTRTDLALDLIANQAMFSTAAGGRDNADNIVILLTDGDSDDTDRTLLAGERLKALGINIITVGVGFLHTDELFGLASRYENAFFAPTFDVLATLLSGVSRRACDAVDKCKDNPCEHFCDGTDTGYTCSCREGYVVNATDSSKCDDINECSYTPSPPCQQNCLNTPGSFQCSCNDGYLVSITDRSKCTDIDECTSGTESPCEQKCTNLQGSFTCSCDDGYVVNPDDPTTCEEVVICKTKADIILMFDASSSIGLANYNKQYDFAKKLIRHFNISTDDVLFSGLVFSYGVQVLFNLHDNLDYASLDEDLTNVAYMNSSTYTHKALQWVIWFDMFGASNGGRPDAKDIIILITDGNPNRQATTEDIAQTLKGQGVTILAIAIGSEITLDKLTKVVSNPDDIVQATGYDQLDKIEKIVADLTCGDSQQP